MHYLQPFFLMMLPRITSALEGNTDSVLGYSGLEMQESTQNTRAIPCLNSQTLKIEAALAGSAVSTVSACACRILLQSNAEVPAKSFHAGRRPPVVLTPRNSAVIWQFGVFKPLISSLNVLFGCVPKGSQGFASICYGFQL